MTRLTAQTRPTGPASTGARRPPYPPLAPTGASTAPAPRRALRRRTPPIGLLAALGATRRP